GGEVGDEFLKLEFLDSLIDGGIYLILN
ncbi:hypothetical protein HKBW3S33_01046, partial [Candidatus Hakubella thermalkaliphila]